MHRRVSARTAMALCDQAVVSGISFLITIIVGRVCGKPELGIYALGMSVVFLALAAQQSLISAAHTVFSVRLEGESRRRYNGAIAIQFLALCGLVAGAIAVVALSRNWFAASSIQGGKSAGAVFGVLVVVCPCILLREFARRFEFARFNMARAFLLDACIAVLTLGLLATLYALALLSGTSALLAVGGACASAGGVWWITSRSQFQVELARLPEEFRRGWQFGRWVFGGQVSFALVGFSLQWMIATMMDEGAVGVYSACLMLVLLANPIVLGIQNVLSPSIAESMHEGGCERVRRLVLQSSMALSLMMATYVSVIAIWGELFLQQLYGDAFGGNGFAIGMLGWGALATASGVASNHGLRAIERPELNFVAAATGLITAVAVGWFLIPSWGVAGAATGFASGCSVTAAARLSAFLYVSSRSRESI